MSDEFPVRVGHDATPSPAAVEEWAAEELKGTTTSAHDALYGRSASDESTPDVDEVPKVEVAYEVDEAGVVSVLGVAVDGEVVHKAAETDGGAA